MERLTEVKIKHECVRKYLKEKQYDGIFLSRIANFSWLTAGADPHVEIDSSLGVGSLLATGDKIYVITNNIEAERLSTEELKGIESEFEFVISSWYDPAGEKTALKKLTAGQKVAADSPQERTAALESDFPSLRYTLTESEIQRYRWLGKHTSTAVEAAGKELKPGMTEHEIEAAIAQKLMAKGIMPTVLLVAADERNYKYRHPKPTDNKCFTFAKLICCARR